VGLEGNVVEDVEEGGDEAFAMSREILDRGGNEIRVEDVRDGNVCNPREGAEGKVEREVWVGEGGWGGADEW
jgi:hypothetical protein